jgi:hypothetical protein
MLLAAAAWAVSSVGARRSSERTPASASIVRNRLAVRHAAAQRAFQRSATPAQKHDIEHIASLVETLQPREGPEYARYVASNIVQSAHENGIHPYVVSATAVVESEFSMKAGPCVGMMQMYPPTVAEVYGRTGRDVNGLEDNIWMGANFLAINYRSKLASRGGSEVSRMRYMWGKYNGSGPNGQYATRALRVLRRIRHGNPQEWKQTMHKAGSLWGVPPADAK